MTGTAVAGSAGTGARRWWALDLALIVSAGFAVAGLALALIFMPARPGPAAGTPPEPRGGDRVAAGHPA